MPWGPHNRPLPQPGRYQRPRHRGGSAATAPRRPLVPWIPQGTAPGSQRPAARIQLGVTCFIKQQLKRVQRPGEGARLPPHAGSSGRCRQDADTELGSPRRQQPPPLGIRGAGESREEPPAGRLQLGFVCPRHPQRPSCRTDAAARRGTSPTKLFTLRPGPQQRWCRGEIVSVVFGEKRRAAPQPELNAARTDRQHQPLLVATGKRRGGGERWLGGGGCLL